MIDNILVLALNFAVASVTIAFIALLVGWLVKSLPARHAVLVAGLAACAAVPIAVTIGWIGNYGYLPPIFKSSGNTVAKATIALQQPIDLARADSKPKASKREADSPQTFLKSKERSQYPQTGTVNPDLVVSSKKEAANEPHAEESKSPETAQQQSATLTPTAQPTPSLRSFPYSLGIPRTIGLALVMVWILGTLFSFAKQTYQWLTTKRLLNGCIPVDDSRLQELVSSCRTELGLTRDPVLLTSQSILFPAVTGFRTPKLIVPASFFDLESKTELRMMLSHELAHLKRNDHRTVFLQAAATTLYWWNPLVHFICNRISQVRELICDDIAIEKNGSWEEYARSIVSIAEKVSQQSPAVVPLGMTAGDLEQRVKRLLTRKGKSAATSVSRACALASIAICLVGVCSLIVAQVPVQTSNAESTEIEEVSFGTTPAPSTQDSQSSLEAQDKEQELLVLTDSKPPLCKATGTVSNLDGQPAKNSELEFWRARKFVGKLKTDNEGKFEFLFNSDHMKYGWIRATSTDGKTKTLSKADVFAYKNPKDKVDIELKLEKLSEHTVEVKDQTGNKLADVDVFAMVGQRSFFKFQGRTDPNGKFVFQVPESKTVSQVIAFHPEKGLDYKSYSVPNGQENRFAETPPFPKTKPEVLVLGNTSPFTVRVIDESDDPIQGVTVYPWLLEKSGYASLNLSDIYDLIAQETDMAGEITFNWIPSWQKKDLTLWPGKKGYDRPRSSYSPSTGNGSKTIKLKALAMISGQVVDESGNPVVGIRVKADGRNCHEQYCESQTDENGKYSFGVRPDQSIIVMVKEITPDKTGRVSTFTKVAVDSTDPINNCDLKLVKPVHVNGKILNYKTRKLVPGHRMTMTRHAMSPTEYKKLVLEDPAWHVKSFRKTSQSSDNWQTIPAAWGGGVTTKTGEFEMHLAPGVYSMRANDDDRPQLFVIEAGEAAEIELLTKAGAKETIQGKLTVDGKPLPGAKVVAVNERFRGDRWETESNKEGEFSVSIRQEPGLVVAFSKDNKFAKAVAFKTVNPRVDLALEPVAKLKGRVMNTKGEPLAATRIYFGTELYVPPYGGFVVTDKEGNFEVPNACPNIELIVSVDNLKTGRREKLVTLPALSPGQSLDLKELQLRETPDWPNPDFR